MSVQSIKTYTKTVNVNLMIRSSSETRTIVRTCPRCEVSNDYQVRLGLNGRTFEPDRFCCPDCGGVVLRDIDF